MTESLPASQHEAPARTIAFVQYPGLTPLDIVGPLQVFSLLAQLAPGYATVVVGERIEPMPTDTPLSLVPSHTFDTMPDPHVLIVPGGSAPTVAAMTDEKLLDRLRTAAARSQILGSVCTGALLLGAAGLLDGRRANTHWMYRGLLPKLGAIPVAERWVRDGNVITAAGVSAGIDMALHLVGELAGQDVAREVQLFVEYDPEPPFGPIDWEASDPTQYTPLVRQRLHQALADHPALLARLTV